MSHTKWCQYSCGIFSYFRSVHGSHSQSWAQNSNFGGLQHDVTLIQANSSAKCPLGLAQFTHATKHSTDPPTVELQV